MRGIVVQRKQLFGFLVVTFLLGLYILCVGLEIEVPWHMERGRFSDIGYIQDPRSDPGQGSLAPPLSPQNGKLTVESGQTHTIVTKTTMLKEQSTKTTAPTGKSSTKPHPATQPGKSSTKPHPATQPGKSSTKPQPGKTKKISDKVDPRTTKGHRRHSTSLPITIEPSFLGDSYTSEDITLHSECPDGIRTRVLQTEFGKRFLSDIPKLQWAKDATKEQYKRLQQYPMPHGWNGLDFQTLVKSLSALNTEANHRMFDDWASRANGSRCIHCAVVGNGGILNGSKKGQEIDQHDYIFRTNGAIIKGFEKDVGERTSFYTFSTNTMCNSMAGYASDGFLGPPKFEETRYLFVPDDDRDYLLIKAAATNATVERGREKNEMPSIYFGNNLTVEKFKMFHPDFIRYLRNRYLRSNILKTKYRNIYRPTTGAVMLLAAIHTCDEVSAYGFITPDYKKYSDHYYDSIYHRLAFYINHDMRMELNLWQDLHQAKLIQLYMRS